MPDVSGEAGAPAPEGSAADILEHAAAILRASGIPCEIETQIADPAAAITSRAEALGCDAIVIGRRGLGAVRAALLGSVSAEVIRRSRLPVAVVCTLQPGMPGVPLRLLLAVDGSDSALRAAAFAARLACVCDSEVHLLHVEPGVTVAGAVFGPRDKLIEHWSGTHTQKALSGARRVLEDAGVDYVEHVLTGADAHSAILEAARENACSVIAMGTRGLGPLTGLLLGSVAQSVLEQAPPGVSAVVLVQ